MSKNELHDWEYAIEKLSHDNADKMLAIAQDIYNTAFVRGKNYMSLEQTRWIPCSERLPKDDTFMLVQYIDRREKAMFAWIGWHEMENVWYIDGNAHCKEFGNEVVAWMPIPKYKEGE